MRFRLGAIISPLAFAFAATLSGCGGKHVADQDMLAHYFFKVDSAHFATFYPNVQHTGNYESKMPITDKDYEAAWSGTCLDKPQMNPNLKLGSTRIWARVNAVFKDITMQHYIGQLEQVTLDRMTALNNGSPTYFHAEIFKDWNKQVVARNSTAEYKITPLTGAGTFPFAMEPASDNQGDNKTAINSARLLIAPQFSARPDVITVLISEASEQHIGEFYDKGIYTFGDGRQVTALRVRSVGKENNNIMAYESMISPEIGDIQDAHCGAGPIASYEVLGKIDASGTFKLSHPPTYDELLTEY